MRRPASPLLALVVVTAIWGYTFVPVQKAIAVYPLFAFLAVRFAISTATLAPFAWGSLRALPRGGWAAGLGAGTLLALAYGLQDVVQPTICRTSPPLTSSAASAA